MGEPGVTVSRHIEWMKALLTLLLLALLPGAGPAAAQSVRLAQPNASRFPEVTLYAYPTDERGVFRSGLGADAFRISENGRPAKVTRVETKGGTLDVCLALDCSISMLEEDRFHYARAASQEFIRHLGGADRSALILFADRSSLAQPLTRDRNALAAAVASAQPSGSSTAFLDGVYWSITQVALRPEGGSVVDAGQARPEARRIVLALTDGIDNASRVSTQHVINYARANGVSVCTVALGSDAQTGTLEYLAGETGGLYLRAPGPHDLQRLYVSLAEQLQREYRVTFRSPHPQADATRREVRVELASMPGAGDAWYQAPGQGSLLITIPAAVEPGSSATSAGSGAPGEGEVSPHLVLGALLVLAGVGAAIGGFFLWLGMRNRPLRIADSNPRIDLLPLWVRDGSTLVGRGAECGLVLDSHQVSRVHARIEAANGIYLVFDEGSRNGTFVNGRRVRRSRELKVGDTVRFGDREFRFSGELQA
jgi:VWFA-related protein